MLPVWRETIIFQIRWQLTLPEKEAHFRFINCGVYGHPIPDAVKIALKETRAALTTTSQFERVVFVCFTRSSDYLALVNGCSNSAVNHP